MENEKWELVTDAGLTFGFELKVNPNITMTIVVGKKPVSGTREDEAWRLLRAVTK
jgi:hypothetical protein